MKIPHGIPAGIYTIAQSAGRSTPPGSGSVNGSADYNYWLDFPPTVGNADEWGKAFYHTA